MVLLGERKPAPSLISLSRWTAGECMAARDRLPPRFRIRGKHQSYLRYRVPWWLLHKAGSLSGAVKPGSCSRRPG
jgi:hypothetical protein